MQYLENREQLSLSYETYSFAQMVQHCADFLELFVGSIFVFCSWNVQRHPFCGLNSATGFIWFMKFIACGCRQGALYLQVPEQAASH